MGTLATMKDAGLRIRVQRELREQFVEICRAQDKPAAQVLREFMRDYVAEFGPALADAGGLHEGNTEIRTRRPKP
jgi:Ribbon-helix-helix protein